MEKPTIITEGEIKKIIDTAATVGLDDGMGKEIMGNMVLGKFYGTNEEFAVRIKAIHEDLESRKRSPESLKNSYAEAIKMILNRIHPS